MLEADMDEPFIIMCAPNGARRTKADHPSIPIMPKELADCAESIVAAGASILHLHVRGDNVEHSLDVCRYQVAIDAVRERVGDQLVIQVTTEAVGRYCRDEQIAMVKELKPEAVSLALREICPDDSQAGSTSEFFGWLQAQGIFPQIILYNEKDAQRFDQMRRTGIFAEMHPFVLCVLGKYGRNDNVNLAELKRFTDILSPVSVPWAACGFGVNETALTSAVIGGGGHIRVGFENNILAEDGNIVPDNAALVALARAEAEKNGQAIATAADVRRRFKIG